MIERFPFFWLLRVERGDNHSVKNLVRVALSLVFISAICLVVFLLLGHKEKETWATLTGLLAVIAAVISALPALRVVELQEDTLRPRPTPYFDLSSRYGLLQLRVKNLGGGIAYDVRLKWNTHPVNHKGEDITSLDHISVLLPQESASALVGASSTIVKTYGSTRYEGEARFRDSSGRGLHQKFICSVDAHQKQLLHDEELPRTLRDLQDIPKEIGRIADELQKFGQRR